MPVNFIKGSPVLPETRKRKKATRAMANPRVFQGLTESSKKLASLKAPLCLLIYLISVNGYMESPSL